VGYRARQISFHTGPLRAGWPDGAPYDLVVSLSPFGWLPGAWLRQCRPGSSIVQVLDLEVPDRLAFLQVDVDDERRPTFPKVLWRVNGDLRNSRYAYSMDAKICPSLDEEGYDIAVAQFS
jgi:protein-L-isoaspartate O-methyltransferase